MLDQRDFDAEARAILRRNDRGSYTVPTAGLYPHQWNWDSAFAALGFSDFDITRAWTELETLFGGQWDNGMVPHILFHQQDDSYFPGPDVWGCTGTVPSSGVSQPPVAATIVRRIWDLDRQTGEEWVRRLYPKMVAWHRWFMTWRLDRGAVCVTHPWEAGRDNAPDWDGPLSEIDPSGVGEYSRRDTMSVDPDMRPQKHDYDRYIWLVNLGRESGWDESRLLERNPFRVADPTMTFILRRANADLAAIGRALGEDVDELEGWTDLLTAGAQSLWNPEIGSFDSRDAHSGKWSGCISNASFLCWFAGLRDNRMLQHFNRIMQAVPYWIPSHDPDSERFDRRRYWRGPVWPVMNALIGIGMEEAGLTEEAHTLRDSTAALVRAGGFSEYFDPCDGSSAGGKDFTWTAAVWLAWVSVKNGKGGWAQYS